MPYTEFHYTPTGTGVISGKEVLEQTEDAINDLGGQISGDVQTAIDTANNALNTANTASADAQNAVNTANTAYTTATNAQNTANAAQTTATNAQTAAQNTQKDVNALGNRVTTAENNITQNTTDISGLTTRMGTAEGNITTLQNDVVTAQGTATSAQNTATLARGQAYVVRYASVAVSDNSSVPYTDLNNTDNIKANDLLLDTTGKLYQISAVDTTNQTVTVGSALVDLALDANVVHNSGNETVSGIKTFDSNTLIYNSDNTATTPNLYLRNSKVEVSSQGNTSGDQNLTYSDKNNTTYAYVKGAIQSNGTAVKIRSIAKDGSDNSVVNELQILAYTNGNKAIFPSNSNEVDLGVFSYKWKSIFATNYYYGANNVEFSTKFVTTDTDQSISARKIFNVTPFIYNPDSTASTPNLFLKSSKAIKGDTSGSNSDNIRIPFTDKNDKLINYIQFRKTSDGSSDITLYCATLDSNNQDISSGLTFFKAVDGSSVLRSISDNDVSLGNNSYKFKDVRMYLLNGLTPSSLSMPTDNIANIIDISGYLTVLDGSQANTYQAPDNGYIGITMSNCTGIQAYITGFWGHQVIRPSSGGVRFFMPICKNMTANILIFGGTIDNARFIPCQGNI